jgi:hypothetical protein
MPGKGRYDILNGLRGDSVKLTQEGSFREV